MLSYKEVSKCRLSSRVEPDTLCFRHTVEWCPHWSSASRLGGGGSEELYTFRKHCLCLVGLGTHPHFVSVHKQHQESISIVQSLALGYCQWEARPASTLYAKCYYQSLRLTGTGKPSKQIVDQIPTYLSPWTRRLLVYNILSYGPVYLIS